MPDTHACPICTMTEILEDPEKHECATCGHEWPREAEAAGKRVVKDSNGNVLQDGDTVLLIKDLKVKGSPVTLKIGTKIKGIRIVDGTGDHEIDAKADGMGIMLKAKFLKKA